MANWIDNADSYRCPVCGHETGNPNYHNCQCPVCGFVADKDALGNDYDLDRLRELVQADREGRCMVLPLVERECVDKFLDDLKDVFSEWGYEDASVGLFGMNESEKQLAKAIIAALEKEVNRNG